MPSLPIPVRLNVGGHLHETTAQTLSNRPGYLRCLSNAVMGMPLPDPHEVGRSYYYTLPQREDGQPFFRVVRDAEGRVFIDRDGRHFSLVLDFLRSGVVHPPLGFADWGALKSEFVFYFGDTFEDFQIVADRAGAWAVHRADVSDVPGRLPPPPAPSPSTVGAGRSSRDVPLPLQHHLHRPDTPASSSSGLTPRSHHHHHHGSATPPTPASGCSTTPTQTGGAAGRLFVGTPPSPPPLPPLPEMTPCPVCRTPLPVGLGGSGATAATRCASCAGRVSDATLGAYCAPCGAAMCMTCLGHPGTTADIHTHQHHRAPKELLPVHRRRRRGGGGGGEDGSGVNRATSPSGGSGGGGSSKASPSKTPPGVKGETRALLSFIRRRVARGSAGGTGWLGVRPEKNPALASTRLPREGDWHLWGGDWEAVDGSALLRALMHDGYDVFSPGQVALAAEQAVYDAERAPGGGGGAPAPVVMLRRAAEARGGFDGGLVVAWEAAAVTLERRPVSGELAARFSDPAFVGVVLPRAHISGSRFRTRTGKHPSALYAFETDVPPSRTSQNRRDALL